MSQSLQIASAKAKLVEEHSHLRFKDGTLAVSLSRDELRHRMRKS